MYDTPVLSNIQSWQLAHCGRVIRGSGWRKSAVDNWQRIALCKLSFYYNAAAAVGSYSTKMAVN